jgi:hypothetical protein
MEMQIGRRKQLSAPHEDPTPPLHDRGVSNKGKSLMQDYGSRIIIPISELVVNDRLEAA